VIEMHLSPIPGSRTPERDVEWRCQTDGIYGRFVATSRLDAPGALARALVGANVPDAPVRVTTEGQPGWGEWRSLHQMAKWTYLEGRSRSLRRVPYAQVEASLAKLREHA
jgi:hypothetical protein